MQLNNDFSKVFDQMKTIQTPKTNTPAGPTLNKQVNPPAGEPKTQQIPKDHAQTSESKQGSATGTIKKDPEAQIDAWKNAAKGEKIDFSKMPKSESKIAVINYLIKDYSAKNLDAGEQKQVQKFFSDIMSKSSKLDDPLKRKEILNIMADGIKSKGLTKDQMDMVASGKFNADAYISLVNKGEPIG